MPVKGATRGDWNPRSFWHYPWGRSGSHKGIDIFAKRGRPVVSSGPGIVLYKGRSNVGGNVVLVLGPKWRFHYYAHLHAIKTGYLDLVAGGEVIGSVGSTGNAQGKQPHLHYSIFSLFPYVWLADDEPQGLLKMFYLDPGSLISVDD